MMSEASQHSLLGLKSSDDHGNDKQQGEFQSFQQTLHSEVRSWKAYLSSKRVKHILQKQVVAPIWCCLGDG